MLRLQGAQVEGQSAVSKFLMGDFLRHKIRDIVFGFEDGLNSTLGALTGIAAGTGSQQIVVISGFVIVAVESISMAAGTYLSAKSERQYLERLLEEERHAIATDPEGEHSELLAMYRQRGFTEEEIHMIAKRLFSNPHWLLEDMAHKELGICPSQLQQPASNSLAMGISYVAGGLVPVLTYLFVPIKTAIPVSVILTAMALFLLGGIKGKLVKQSWWVNGLEMLGIAGVSCAIGFTIGRLGRGWIH